jgi:sugar phosphate isomerase/epimerase
MELLILCTQWGHEYLQPEDFLRKVKDAGYDGVDTWLPEDKSERRKFISLLNKYDLSIVSHQHQAKGNSIDEFCKSFEYYLQISMECNPLLINSHSGKDYFTIDEQLRIIDTAQNFSVKNNIRIAHETHRGRIGYSPVNARQLFALRPEMKINADFSHWVCVTESYLENFSSEVEEAIKKTEHIHARVGFLHGPQIPDPQDPFWQKEVQFFMDIWGWIISFQHSQGAEYFTITTEFGPPPYMWVSTVTKQPVVDQWDVNDFMKNLLRNTFENTKDKKRLSKTSSNVYDDNKMPIS